MEKRFFSLQLFIFRHRVVPVSSIIFLLVMTSIMWGCDQAEITSPEEVGLTSEEMELLPSLSPKASIFSDGLVTINVFVGQNGVVQFTGSPIRAGPCMSS